MSCQTEAKTPGKLIAHQGGTIALDSKTLKLPLDEVVKLDHLAKQAAVKVLDDAYIFATSLDGSQHGNPDTITQFFKRLSVRAGLPRLTFKLLRTFMDTYGQELGYSTAQVALRAGHDPAVAAMKLHRQGFLH